MAGASEKFIDAAVAPLAADAELQLAAREQLAEALAQASASSDEALESASQRLDQAGSGDRWRRWRIALYVLVAVVSIWALGGSWRLASVLIRSQWHAYDYGVWWVLWTNNDVLFDDFQTSSHLTSPHKQLLVWGDTYGCAQCGNRQRPAEPLLDPHNPAYLAECLRLGMKVPEGDSVLQTARELDPQNSYFTLVGASCSAENGLAGNSAALEEAISLFHQAAAQTDFNSYTGELMRQRMALLPTPRETLDLLPFARCFPQPSDGELDPLIDALRQHATTLADTGDAARLAILISAWQAVCENILQSYSTDPTNGQLGLRMIRGPLDEFIMASERLGLAQESARLRGIADRYQALASASLQSLDEFPRSDYAASVLPPNKLSPRTPDLHPQDFRPGLAAEFAQLCRALALGGWLLLFSVTLCAALFRFRAGALGRRLAPRLAHLLRPADFTRILGYGIGLPIIFHTIISRFTPLGRNFLPLRGDTSTAIHPVEGNCWAIADQFLALVLLLIALPLVVARWRLTRRARAVGLASRSHLLWVAILAAFAAVPLLGVGDFSFHPNDDIGSFLSSMTGSSGAEGIFYYIDKNWFSVAAVLLIAVLAVALLGIAVTAAFSRQRQLLRRLVLAECLVPVYATATLVMAILAITFHAEEKYWVAHDPLLSVPPTSPFLTRFDQQAAKDVHQDLVEIWGKADE